MQTVWGYGHNVLGWTNSDIHQYCFLYKRSITDRPTPTIRKEMAEYANR
jgi:hypothetical protein